MYLKKRKRIVFIGHEASLSGAPVLLSNLLLLLKKEANLEIFLVIKRYGTFLKNYEAEFPLIVLKGKNYGKESNLLKRIVNAALNRFRLTQLFFKAAFADVIFSNTITNGRLLKLLYPFKKRIVTYVHELESVIEWYMPSGDSAYSLHNSQRFAYPSLKVAQVLEKKYKIDQNKLYRLSYYFPVDLTIIADEIAKRNFATAFREKYNLAGSFLVGNAGVLCKRKGTDLFIEVCRKVSTVNKNIKFCWIGKFEDAIIERELMELIRENKMEDHIVLTGALTHNYFNFSSFDLLFLSSREDPYPLVVLESAFMKVPAICFEDAGGIAEFVDAGAGWPIKDFSIDDAANKILELFNSSRELIRERGETAFRKALELHSDKKIILDQFNQLINGL